MSALKNDRGAAQRDASDAPTIGNLSLPRDTESSNANDNSRQGELREHDELRLNFIGAKLDEAAHLLYAATVAFGCEDDDLFHDSLRRFALDAKMLITAANEHRRQMRARREGGAA